VSDAALEFFRSHRLGVLLADELAEPIRFVTDAAGRLVFPAIGAVLAAESLVLFVPEEAPDGDELQLMLSAEEANAEDEACDRWRTYHGEPRLSKWAVCTIEGAKLAGEVVEHEALAAPNPLRRDEGRLCRMLNADRPALVAAVRRRLGVEISDPLAVGVDSGGFDVRARFGIVRVPFDRSAPNAQDATAMIEAILHQP
jgi:hypothetical protein